MEFLIAFLRKISQEKLLRLALVFANGKTSDASFLRAYVILARHQTLSIWLTSCTVTSQCPTWVARDPGKITRSYVTRTE